MSRCVLYVAEARPCVETQSHEGVAQIQEVVGGIEPMKKDQAKRVDTATQILDVAERLVQLRGFNGFSYADVAAELKLTKAAPPLPLCREGRTR